MRIPYFYDSSHLLTLLDADYYAVCGALTAAEIERDEARAHLAAQVTANQMLAAERDRLQADLTLMTADWNGALDALAEWRYTNRLLMQELDGTKQQLERVFAQRDGARDAVKEVMTQLHKDGCQLDSLRAELATQEVYNQRARAAEAAAIAERDEAVQVRDYYRALLVAAGLLPA